MHWYLDGVSQSYFSAVRIFHRMIVSAGNGWAGNGPWLTAVPGPRLPGGRQADRRQDRLEDRHSPARNLEVEADRELVVGDAGGLDVQGQHFDLKLTARALEHRSDRLQDVQFDRSRQGRDQA